MALPGTLASLLRPIPFRGKPRLLDPLTPQKGERRARIFGYDVLLDLSNYVDRMIYLGCYEPLNTWRFRRLLQPGMTCVDVGANLGYFSLLAARRVGPQGRVFAFEPHPTNFALLERHVQSNHLNQVSVFRQALGDSPGTGHIGMIDASLFPNRTASMVGTGEDQPACPVTTLDDFVAARGIDRIDLLKIDVDGYESKILAGARTCLEAGVVKHLIVELNDTWLAKSGASRESLIRTLESAGFRDEQESDRLASLLLGPVEDRRFSHRSAVG